MNSVQRPWSLCENLGAIESICTCPSVMTHANMLKEEDVGLLFKIIDTLGTILTYNFVIICLFFAWFLTGVGAQYGAQNTTLIEAFRAAWDVLILPLLTTHMTLTFLSWDLEKASQGGEEKA